MADLGATSPAGSPDATATGRSNVVALLGGLGNQLFQVAFGRWLEERTGRHTSYDISCLPSPEPAVLDVPGVGLEVRERIKPGTRYLPGPDGRAGLLGRTARRALPPHRLVRNYEAAGPDLSNVPTPAAWWFGYWQRRQYAAALVGDLTEALSPVRAERMVVGVHVRRGDMLRTPSAVQGDWFRRALQRLGAEVGDLRQVDVRVWSDDPVWCRDELVLGVPFDVARYASAVEHLAELAACDGLVISRSTYSWWAAAVASRLGAPVVFPEPWGPLTPARDALEPLPGWVPVSDLTATAG